MTLLYCKERVMGESVNQNQNSWKVFEFTPSVRKIYLMGEDRNIKKALVRLYFQIMTLGKAKLICAANDSGEVMHTSYLVPKCFKFSFIRKNEYEVGSCYTNPKFRGQGIYPTVLDYICSNYADENALFYMIVDDKNTSSIRGIEKAGFKICGKVRKTRILKRYCLLSETDGEKR